MSMKAIVTIIAILVVVLGVWYFMNNSGQPATQTVSVNPGSQTGEVTQQAAATGNIDDAASAILTESLSDDLTQTETDPDSYIEDSKAIDDFGQSFSSIQL